VLPFRFHEERVHWADCSTFQLSYGMWDFKCIFRTVQYWLGWVLTLSRSNPTDMSLFTNSWVPVMFGILLWINYHTCTGTPLFMLHDVSCYIFCEHTAYQSSLQCAYGTPISSYILLVMVYGINPSIQPSAARLCIHPSINPHILPTHLLTMWCGPSKMTQQFHQHCNTRPLQFP